MDGFKEQLKYSIRLRLSFWLCLAITAAALATGTFSYYGAFDEANEMQDDILRQVAALVGQQPKLAQVLATSRKDADRESNLIVQPLLERAADGQAGAALALPTALKDGLQTVEVEGEFYRVMAKTLQDGQRFAVSQQTQVRDEIARDSALRALLPWLILVPVLLLIVADLVRKMLRPVTTLATEVQKRGEQDLQPLPARNLPLEIRPFVTAINGLLGRVARAMDTQRRFVADAAHELRSPLTALSLQAERVEAAEMSPEARERVRTLRQGIERGRHLLDQLLSLARAQNGAAPVASVSLHAICRRVLEDLLPLAEAKGIDLGMQPGQDAHVTGSETDLTALVRNLVDNALRYTPSGGRVDLVVAETEQHTLLQIEDSGPGIPAHERQRVLDPFYRVLGSQQTGSGLGLSIVKMVLERLNGRIELSDATKFAHGLSVTVRLPRPSFSSTFVRAVD
jgi:two-component system OmpR family sensor kinase